MILAKKTAKPLILSGELVPTGVCVDSEKGTFLILDNLKRLRTDHVKVDSYPMEYSLECAIALATL